MEDYRIRFEQKLRQLRKAKGLSQAQLDEATDLSNNFVSLLELGDSSPSFETLKLLADALKVKVAELFNFENEGEV